MKTNHRPVVSFAVLLVLGVAAGACAARTGDGEGEGEGVASVDSELATDPPSPWGDGDTMGDGFGKKSAGPVKHCPTGKQKLDCIKHCGGVSVDDCISACTSCY